MVWPTLGSRTAKEQNRTSEGKEGRGRGRKGPKGSGRKGVRLGEVEGWGST